MLRISMRVRLHRFELVHRGLAGPSPPAHRTIASIAAIVFLTAGWVAWFSHDLTAGLPDRTALRGIGDMAQSTTILDAADTAGLHHLQGTAD